jgi:uncharacterized YigZ family protein
LAFAFPVEDEEEIKPIIQQLRKEHHSARHHCFAWRLGFDGANYRVNDDGEPSGTAGRPIYGQMLSFGVTNTLIVVVRYFGGTLLGVSGLINAYKSAAMLALQNSWIVEKPVEKQVRVVFGYPAQNTVMKIIKDIGAEVKQSVYNLDCTIVVSIRLGKSKSFLEQLSKIEGVKTDVVNNG